MEGRKVKQTIQPLETEYRGCRFRSRTEARWAVFFETLGVPWQYEPEGYALPIGNYLPDFLLNHELFIEIKPLWSVAVPDGLIDDEGNVNVELARQYTEACDSGGLRETGELAALTGIPAVVIAGTPGRGSGWLRPGDFTIRVPRQSKDLCGVLDGLFITFAQGRRDSRELWIGSDVSGWNCINPIVPPEQDKWPIGPDHLTGELAPGLTDAMNVARAERFGT
jgi:hypothetical protein